MKLRLSRQFFLPATLSLCTLLAAVSCIKDPSLRPGQSGGGSAGLAGASGASDGSVRSDGSATGIGGGDGSGGLGGSEGSGAASGSGGASTSGGSGNPGRSGGSSGSEGSGAASGSGGSSTSGGSGGSSGSSGSGWSGGELPPGVIWHPIAAGVHHTCALVEQGRVKCWGNSFYGQSGDGSDSTDNRYAPVLVLNLESVVSLSAAQLHSCALLGDGTVKCWGYDREGQLGIGSALPTIQYAAVSVVDLSGVVDMQVGGFTSCALLGNGTIKCWGFDGDGQVGEANDPSSTKPFPTLVEGISTAVGLTVGYGHACATLQDGSAVCWGSNERGEIGNGKAGGQSEFVPVPVSDLSDVKLIRAGSRHTCAVLTNGKVRCWGYDQWGQLGEGDSDPSYNKYVPVDVPSLSDVEDLSLGGLHSCARLTDGTVQCWGNNQYGQLGINASLDFTAHVPTLVGSLSGIAALASGDWHSCALDSTGALKCWGAGEFGRLGPGTSNNDNQASPTAVFGF